MLANAIQANSCSSRSCNLHPADDLRRQSTALMVMEFPTSAYALSAEFS